MKKFIISLFLGCCSIIGKQANYGLMSIIHAEEVHNPFLVPDKYVLSSGVTIYLSYLAALKDAQINHKMGILVFFSDDPEQSMYEGKYLWDDMLEETVCIPASLLQKINLVIMRKGMIRPSEFYPKMDPIIFHMIDFLERFPTLDLSQPSVILISINEDGKDTLQEVREFNMQ